MKRVAKAGVLSVNFGGGEPLLRDDLLDVAKCAHGQGLGVSMNSNGFLIDRAMSEKLKASGFSKIGISIDSHLPEVHGGFRGIIGSHQKATAALAHLKAAGIRTSLSTVICRINHTAFRELIAFALEQGVQQLNFHNFKCSGLGYSNKDDLDLSADGWRDFYIRALNAKQLTKGLEISLDDPIIASLGVKTGTGAMVRGSACGKVSLNIKSNGDITPCRFIPIVTGNIVTHDLKEIWSNSPVLAGMRNKKPRASAQPAQAMPIASAAAVRALALTGDINNPDPHCWI